MIRELITGSALAMFLVAPAAIADQQKNTENFVVVQSENQWLASDFTGRSVHSNSGQELGDINDLVFNESGQVVAAVLGVGGVLGIGEKNVAVPFDSIDQKPGKDGKVLLVVNLSKSDLEKAPKYKSRSGGQAMMKQVQNKASDIGEKAKEMGKDAMESTKEIGEEDMTKDNKTTQ